MAPEQPPADKRAELFDRLRLNRQARGRPKPAVVALPGIVQGEGYFGARMPMRWFVALGQLPGKTVLLGLLLWHWATLKKGNAVIAVRPGEARTAGLLRNAMYGALAELQAAGLIEVTRQRGKAAVVRILDVPGADPGRHEVTP